MVKTRWQLRLEEERGSLEWPRHVGLFRGAGLEIRLLEGPASSLAEPVGVWQFPALDGQVLAIEVDLWHIDLYSVRVRTISGTRLAANYLCSQTPTVSPHMILRAAWNTPHGYAGTLDGLLLVPPSDVQSIRGRLRRSQVAPIEWFFLELTNRCNYDCVWCPTSRQTRPRGMMPRVEAFRLLDEIADYRRRWPLFSLYAEIRNLIFLHVLGEPLLHPNFLEIVDHGHARGLDFCLVTNGSLLDDGLIQCLLDSGLRSIVVSLNAPDPSSYAATSAPVPYERVVEMIGALVRERFLRGVGLPRIEIQLLNTASVDLPGSPLVERTDQVAQQLLFWKDLVREQERASNEVPPQLDRTEAGRWQETLTYPAHDVRSYFELGRNVWLVFKEACNFGNVLLPEGASVRDERAGRCPLRNPYRVLCVFYDGSTSFCSLDYDNSVNLGNVFENSIESVWGSRRLDRIRRLMDHGILTERLCRHCLGVIVHTRS